MLRRHVASWRALELRDPKAVLKMTQILETERLQLRELVPRTSTLSRRYLGIMR